jgi:hypothetical protein
MKCNAQGGSFSGETPQHAVTGFVGNDGAVSVPHYTASATPYTAHLYCQCAGRLSLLACRLLDVHVLPWLACQECCLPQWLCHCQAGG